MSKELIEAIREVIRLGQMVDDFSELQAALRTLEKIVNG